MNKAHTLRTSDVYLHLETANFTNTISKINSGPYAIIYEWYLNYSWGISTCLFIGSNS